MAGHTVSPARDRLRHALQTPIASPKYCVFYLEDGREKSTAWFTERGHAQNALSLLQKRCGRSNAVIFMD